MVDIRHGLCNKKPSNTRPFELVKEVVMFIRNYAEKNALFLPGRVASNRNIVKLLPSDSSRVSIHTAYEKVCNDTHHQAVSIDIFRRLWARFCPDVILQKPITDLCVVCQQNYTQHSKLRGMSDKQKAAFCKKCQEHLHVFDERGFYKNSIKKSKSQNWCSYDGVVHYSFDFAQQVYIPSEHQQPSQLYFLVPYKVGLFDVICDTTKKQANFVIPEANLINKGGNAVVSYLHYYFQHHGQKETEMLLHADNAVGQNKKHIVLGYLAWRVIKKFNKSILLSFLPTGHTKFGCDQVFGVFKKCFRRTACSSLEDVCRVVKNSTLPSGINFPVLTADYDCNVRVLVFEWQQYFQTNNLNPLPKISLYHHFYFSSEYPGVVHHFVDCHDLQTKSSINSHVIFDRNGTDFNLNPNELFPLGLSEERVQYLYERIHPFVRKELKDKLCLKPLGALLKETPTGPLTRKRGKQ